MGCPSLTRGTHAQVGSMLTLVVDTENLSGPAFDLDWFSVFGPKGLE
jgi:hypothetical protein